jgi:hypothetical protein
MQLIISQGLDDLAPFERVMQHLAEAICQEMLPSHSPCH